MQDEPNIFIYIGVKFITHPWTLVLGTIVTLFLWVPFGEGYYGVPWTIAFCRYMMYIFEFGFPICALWGCVNAFQPKFSTARFTVCLIAFLAGVYGLYAMFDWLGRDVFPPKNYYPKAMLIMIRPCLSALFV